MTRRKKEIAMPPLDDERYNNDDGISEGTIAPSKMKAASSTTNSNGPFKDEFGVPEEVPEYMKEDINMMNEEQDQSQETESYQQEQAYEEQSQEPNNNQEEVDQGHSEEPSDKPNKPKETQQAQESFRAVREAKEKAEKERDAIMQQLMEYQKAKEAQQQNKKEPDPAPVDDDIDFSLDEDGLVEGRYVKKVTNKIKKLEKQLQEYESNYKKQTTETRIKNQFPDFDKVVSDENIKYLRQYFPEVADTLSRNDDLYSKAASAYNVIKKFGIYKDNPHDDTQEQALQNSKKPKPANAASPQKSTSPLSRARAYSHGLTEEQRKQNLKEMLQYRKNR